MCIHAKSLQSYLTLGNPMGCGPPGSSVRGILQARILEWVAIPSSRGSFWPRDRTCISYVSCISRSGSLPLVPLGKPLIWAKISFIWAGPNQTWLGALGRQEPKERLTPRRCKSKEGRFFDWLSCKVWLALCDWLSLVAQFCNQEVLRGSGLGWLTQAVKMLVPVWRPPYLINVTAGTGVNGTTEMQLINLQDWSPTVCILEARELFVP